MKENSYTELMKSSAMGKKKLKENFMLDLYVDMVISESLLKAEKDKLLTLIDQAIDTRNKETFMELSKQFRELNKRFGT